MLKTPPRKNVSYYETFVHCFGPGEKNEMDGACSAYEEEERRIKGSGGET